MKWANQKQQQRIARRRRHQGSQEGISSVGQFVHDKWSDFRRQSVWLQSFIVFVFVLYLTSAILKQE